MNKQHDSSKLNTTEKLLYEGSKIILPIDSSKNTIQDFGVFDINSSKQTLYCELEPEDIGIVFYGKNTNPNKNTHPKYKKNICILVKIPSQDRITHISQLEILLSETEELYGQFNFARIFSNNEKTPIMLNNEYYESLSIKRNRIKTQIDHNSNQTLILGVRNIPKQFWGVQNNTIRILCTPQANKPQKIEYLDHKLPHLSENPIIFEEASYNKAYKTWHLCKK